MATLSFSPAAVSGTIRIDPAPPVVRETSGKPQSTTVPVVVTADPPADPHNPVDLEVIDAPEWLVCQVEANGGDPFEIILDASGIEIVGQSSVRFSATIRATADGYNPATLPVALLVVPVGAPAKG